MIIDILLILSVVFAVGVFGYAISVPNENDRYSSIYVLTESESGQLRAGNFTTEIELGDEIEVIVGIDNNEYRPLNYTVIAIEQDISVENNETNIKRQREISKSEKRLNSGETWNDTHSIRPTLTGEYIRIVWLLYIDRSPSLATLDDADSRTHIWVTVDNSSSVEDNL